jgi:hypothetical protein
VLDEPLITGALFFVVENQVELSMICGKVIRMCDSIVLSQLYYVEKLFKKFKYFGIKILSIPYDPNAT